MRVIIACEYSGIVREAFKAKGHEALSCDLLPTEIPGYHWQGDIFECLKFHHYNFDLMIGHPPCTFLCNSGVRWLYERNEIDGKKIGDRFLYRAGERFKNMALASEFFMKLLNSKISRICLENPIPHKYACLPKYSQIIQPWMYGHGETKATCLWLKGLPRLNGSNVVEGREQKIWKMPPGKERSKLRSKTYSGIANAMAEQWG